MRKTDVPGRVDQLGPDRRSGRVRSDLDFIPDVRIITNAPREKSGSGTNSGVSVHNDQRQHACVRSAERGRNNGARTTPAAPPDFPYADSVSRHTRLLGSVPPKTRYTFHSDVSRAPRTIITTPPPSGLSIEPRSVDSPPLKSFSRYFYSEDTPSPNDTPSNSPSIFSDSPISNILSRHLNSAYNPSPKDASKNSPSTHTSPPKDKMEVRFSSASSPHTSTNASGNVLFNSQSGKSLLRARPSSSPLVKSSSSVRRIQVTPGPSTETADLLASANDVNEHSPWQQRQSPSRFRSKSARRSKHSPESCDNSVRTSNQLSISGGGSTRKRKSHHLFTPERSSRAPSPLPLPTIIITDWDAIELETHDSDENHESDENHDSDEHNDFLLPSSPPRPTSRVSSFLNIPRGANTPKTPTEICEETLLMEEEDQRRGSIALVGRYQSLDEMESGSLGTPSFAGVGLGGLSHTEFRIEKGPVNEIRCSAMRPKDIIDLIIIVVLWFIILLYVVKGLATIPRNGL